MSFTYTYQPMAGDPPLVNQIPNSINHDTSRRYPQNTVPPRNNNHAIIPSFPVPPQLLSPSPFTFRAHSIPFSNSPSIPSSSTPSPFDQVQNQKQQSLSNSVDDTIEYKQNGGCRWNLTLPPFNASINGQNSNGKMPMDIDAKTESEASASQSITTQSFNHWNSNRRPQQSTVHQQQKQKQHNQRDDSSNHFNHHQLLAAKEELELQSLQVINLEPSSDSIYHCFIQYLHPESHEDDRTFRLQQAHRLKEKCANIMRGKGQRQNTKNTLKALSDHLGLNVTLHSMNHCGSISNQKKLLRRTEIKFDSKKFKHIALLRYTEYPQPIGMYHLVVPYPNYSARSNGDLKMIHKMREWDILLQREEEEWNSMRNLMNEMLEYAPNGYEIQPRYHLVKMDIKDLDIPMSLEVVKLRDFVHSKFMNHRQSQSNGGDHHDDDSNSISTGTVSVTSISTEFKMDVDGDDDSDIPFVIRSVGDNKGDYIYLPSIQHFLQRNGLYNKSPDINVDRKGNVCLNQQQILMVDRSGYKKKRKLKSEKIPTLPLLDRCYKLLAQCDIAKHVVLGQYLGVQVLDTEYDDIYHSTTRQCEYDLFQYTIKLDTLSSNSSPFKFKCTEISIDSLRMALQYGQEVIWLHLRDSHSERKENVTFIKVFVNDWPAIFLVTTKDIEKGQELMSCYPIEFRELSQQCHDCKKRVKAKKKRIHKIKKSFKRL